MGNLVLFACGGTAGHINPALAVAQILSSRGVECVFVGNRDGMESRLVKQAGFKFYEFRAMGIQRKLSFSNIIKNIKSVALLLTGKQRAKALISKISPDVVVGTGGYVSAPILHTASTMKIPTLIHEQNAFPGVTNKILAPKVDTVLVAVERAKDYLKAKNPIVVTGNPVRSELFEITREEAKAILGIPKDRICVLSFGGSLGADAVNNAALELIKRYSNNCHHIHAVGRDTTEFLEKLKAMGVDIHCKNLDIRQYIDNMPVCLIASDVVICRAGAMTLAELTAVGRASVLIPSPNVAENHQYHNAKVLSDNSAAYLLEEKDLTGESLSNLVDSLISKADLRYNMENRAKKMGIKNASQQIVDRIDALLT